MIVRPRPHWLRMLFIWRGSVLPRIMPQLLFTTGLAVIVACTHGTLGEWKPTLTLAPFTLLGLAVAIFLGFRNSASYDRYWEARRIWGALLNDSRTLARQVLTLTDCTHEEKRAMVYLLVAFVHALRNQLRQKTDDTALLTLIPAADHERVRQAQYKPAVILVLFSEKLSAARKAGQVEPILASAFEPALGGLSHVLGGCERIANTPIPFTYSVIIHRVIYLYCILLPFGLVDSVGPLTPLVVAFVAYTFFALEALSDELEEPFGTMPNDLPLDAMTRSIERTLRETVGETNLPPAAMADSDFLLS
ncbi:MAG: bestrophin family ion channel [Nibricoccus sp.]